MTLFARCERCGRVAPVDLDYDEGYAVVDDERDWLEGDGGKDYCGDPCAPSSWKRLGPNPPRPVIWQDPWFALMPPEKYIATKIFPEVPIRDRGAPVYWKFGKEGHADHPG